MSTTASLRLARRTRPSGWPHPPQWSPGLGQTAEARVSLLRPPRATMLLMAIFSTMTVLIT